MAKSIFKKLFPGDFGDYLSILSFIGFLAIIFKFGFNNTFLDEALTPLFLIIGGAGLMVVGKIFTFPKWARDGIQKSEFSLLFTLISGLVSIILGVLLLVNVSLPLSIQGWIGFLAFFPAGYIMIDYWLKNTNGRYC